MEGIPRTSHCNIKHRVDPHEYLYDYQGKRVNPHIDLLPDVGTGAWYTVLPRARYSREAWTTQATFLVVT